MILYLSAIFVREPNNNGINSLALARNIENIAHFSSKHFQSRSLNYAYITLTLLFGIVLYIKSMPIHSSLKWYLIYSIFCRADPVTIL